ncbi:ABC transporter permease [Patescibacteria group bacterium]|nr:ABC transporter permease [Patescibacteria group bacterium]MBU4367357.1 ABC transporter permease [Patescibacteria group bacterium]MBU4461976.1 ABC transporter permease [Patescibacteria group bacterium]MCG2699657.1 ABC transporter permease [Candidatus Parcubacteria bacterium]
MLTNFKRILKFAGNDFSRNRGNNAAAIFVLVIPILLATSLFLFQGLSQSVISQIQSKMDVTAFFKEDVAEEDILAVRDELLRVSSEVKSIQYVSKEKALQDFIDRHKDNPDFMQALAEVGVNPFLASLNILTDQPHQYEKVSAFLESGPFSELIEKVDYSQKKDTIEKFSNISSSINKFGFILGGVLFLIAILVVFNTIKLSIDNSKDEITAMRLVGASNWFIRGPFIIQGMICGFIAFLICLIVSGVAAYFLSPKIEILAPGFSIFSYFISNLGIIALIQIGFGVGLGVLAGFILVRSYLKV